MKAKEVNITLPRNVLEALLKGTQTNVPFQTDELGFPLRIVVWSVAAEPKPKKFGGLT